MEAFVDFIFGIFEFVVPLHFILLFFGHVKVFALRHLFGCKWPFDEAEYVLGDYCLHLKWKVLFYVIVSSTNDTEVVVGCEANRLNLLHEVLFGFMKLLGL